MTEGKYVCIRKVLETESSQKIINSKESAGVQAY
jgi:hypothetical protein